MVIRSHSSRLCYALLLIAIVAIVCLALLFAAERASNPLRSERMLRRLVDEHPDQYVLHDLLGKLLYERGRYAEAADVYSTALSCEGVGFNSFYSLAGCLMKQGDQDGALRVMNDAYEKASLASNAQEQSTIKVVIEAIRSGEFVGGSE